MSAVWLPLHIAFAGLWLGCVLTEALFERALLGQGRDQERILVRLHRRVDLLIEIPAFTLVLLTGGMLLMQAGILTPLLQVKVAFGVLAVAVNIYCVWLVLRRAAAVERGQWEEFARLDHLQHIYGAVVLLALVVALAIGVYRFSGG